MKCTWFAAKPLISNESDLTLNQRVPGSSPGAPTINVLQIINYLKHRWEAAASRGIFGKLLGNSVVLAKYGLGSVGKGAGPATGGARQAPPVSTEGLRGGRGGRLRLDRADDQFGVGRTQDEVERHPVARSRREHVGTPNSDELLD
jgi:hypothetical protein